MPKDRSPVRPLLNKRTLKTGLILSLFAFVAPALSQVAPGGQPANHQTLDDQFSLVAAQVPEFGGMFLGNDGRVLYVNLTDTAPTKLAAARQAIVNVFGAAVVPSGGVAARRGTFGFGQLRQWYMRLTGPALAVAGVTMTDIDETANRIAIGVETDRVESRILNVLAGVPANAVTFVVTGRIEIDSTLQSSRRAVQGGFEIGRRTSTNSGILCTLGFNAMSASVNGFVTASHCTQAPWAVDNAGLTYPSARFYQNSPGVANQFVGTETIDPHGFTGNPFCPSGQTCRWSDSAFIAYPAGVPSSLGTEARTTSISISWLSPPPNVTIDALKPVFAVGGQQSLPLIAGLVLDKTGRTTGWSEGPVAATCANMVWSELPNATLLCQYVVHCTTNACANAGDSGSGVYRITNLSMSYGELYGILWARYFGSHSYLIFSPIQNVQWDLGPLTYSAPCFMNPNPCR